MPGISMEQEKTVWWGKEKSNMVVTMTSYMSPLLRVVVVMSPSVGCVSLGSLYHTREREGSGNTWEAEQDRLREVARRE